jgi:hypothetical protein
MLDSLRLPLRFDPQGLKSDLEKILPGEWVAHFNQSYYEGEWSGVALKSVGGVASQLYPDPTKQGTFADTEILARCTYIQQVLASFRCQTEAVRFLKLSAGSSIREHRDYKLGYEDGVVRVHIPVHTNADVQFFLDGKRLSMLEGECWYLNFNLPHRVENRSSQDRVHLVIDCVLNDWLDSLFGSAQS